MREPQRTPNGRSGWSRSGWQTVATSARRRERLGSRVAHQKGQPPARKNEGHETSPERCTEMEPRAGLRRCRGSSRSHAGKRGSSAPHAHYRRYSPTRAPDESNGRPGKLEDVPGAGPGAPLAGCAMHRLRLPRRDGTQRTEATPPEDLDPDM